MALPVTAIVAMFLAVWMLYAADRLLDARALDSLSPPAAQLEPRHFFHHAHRRAFLAAIVLSAIALAILLPQLNPEALRLYALLASLLFAWLLLVHTRLAADRRLPKEVAVAIFFPAAIFIPTVARHPELRPALILPALLLAFICALNCLYLYLWEHPADRSSANWTTRLTTARIVPLTWLVIIVSLLCDPLRLSAPSLFVVSAAFSRSCALSAGLLLLLHFQRRRLSPLTLRAAADLALLTPVFFLR